MGFDVKGKNALVTGANRGIGKAITHSLLKAGAAKVYAAVRDTSSVSDWEEVAAGKVVPVECDLTKPETIEAAAKTATDVSLVINNAGVLTVTSGLDADAIESLQYEINVNVYGLMRMAQAFAEVLKANGGGAFVQLNSVASQKSFPEFTTYCASKAASYSVTQALRSLLAEQGTAVHSVHPGPIDTDMGTTAGFEGISDPPAMVGEAIVAALQSGDFHVFPDTMAKQVGAAYESFAKNVVEADMMEG